MIDLTKPLLMDYFVAINMIAMNNMYIYDIVCVQVYLWENS